MKQELDIKGKELKHGDKVITIVVNYRAKGGDLGFAYVFKPDSNKPARLVDSAEDLEIPNPYPRHKYYKRLEGKVLIINDKTEEEL